MSYKNSVINAFISKSIEINWMNYVWRTLSLLKHKIKKQGWNRSLTKWIRGLAFIHWKLDLCLWHSFDNPGGYDEHHLLNVELIMKFWNISKYSNHEAELIQAHYDQISTYLIQLLKSLTYWDGRVSPFYFSRTLPFLSRGRIIKSSENKILKYLRHRQRL